MHNYYFLCFLQGPWDPFLGFLDPHSAPNGPIKKGGSVVSNVGRLILKQRLQIVTTLHGNQVSKLNSNFFVTFYLTGYIQVRKVVFCSFILPDEVLLASRNFWSTMWSKIGHYLVPNGFFPGAFELQCCRHLCRITRIFISSSILLLLEILIALRPCMSARVQTTM